MDSSFIQIIAIALCAFIGVGGFGYYFLVLRQHSETRRDRLGFVERVALDGGRKLLLIRRDDVEHLIMIGGPVDMVIETGIRPPHLGAPGEGAQDYYADGRWGLEAKDENRTRITVAEASLTQKLKKMEAEPTLELTPAHEAPER